MKRSIACFHRSHRDEDASARKPPTGSGPGRLSHYLDEFAQTDRIAGLRACSCHHAIYRPFVASDGCAAHAQNQDFCPGHNLLQIRPSAIINLRCSSAENPKQGQIFEESPKMPQSPAKGPPNGAAECAEIDTPRFYKQYFRNIARIRFETLLCPRTIRKASGDQGREGCVPFRHTSLKYPP